MSKNGRNIRSDLSREGPGQKEVSWKREELRKKADQIETRERERKNTASLKL